MGKIVIKGVSAQETSPSGEVINESSLLGVLELELNSDYPIEEKYLNSLRDCLASLVEAYCVEEGDVFQILVE